MDVALDVKRFCISNKLKIIKCLGSGGFGKVYLMQHLTSKRFFALKACSRLTKQDVFVNEIKMLKSLSGKCNIIRLLAVSRIRCRILLLMDYFPYDSLSEILYSMDFEEIKMYIYNLLIALRYLHANGIMHRDVKPANFLYNRNIRKYALIDFGFAEHCSVKQMPKFAMPSMMQWSISDHQCKCGIQTVCNHCLKKRTAIAGNMGTRGYQSLEILISVPHYTPAVDIWAAGIVFITLLSKTYPFWVPENDLSAVGLMISLFGTKNVHNALANLGYKLISQPVYPSLDLRKVCQTMSWLSCGNSDNEEQQQLTVSCEKCAPAMRQFHKTKTLPFDLLRKMLDIDYQTRITAEVALRHRFFAS
ncbi:putative cell division control protein [Trichinella pseudospiralis]